MKDIKLVLDHHDHVTLEEFIEANTAEDVEPLTLKEIEGLKALKVGEALIVGCALVERIK